MEKEKVTEFKKGCLVHYKLDGKITPLTSINVGDIGVFLSINKSGSFSSNDDECVVFWFRVGEKKPVYRSELKLHKQNK